MNGNLERAVGILLSGPPPPAPEPPVPTTVVDTVVDMTPGDEDDELRRAIELSKEMELKEKKARGDKQRKAARAASNNAAASAALSRLNGSSTTAQQTKATPAAVSSHPFVKVPKTLAEKSYKEQVLRTVFRVSPHSLAVDTLIKTLETIKTNKTNPKYRSIGERAGELGELREPPTATHTAIYAARFARTRTRRHGNARFQACLGRRPGSDRSAHPRDRLQARRLQQEHVQA